MRSTNAIEFAHTGCRVLIPLFDAIAPVMNGRTAEPACPKPAIHPIDAVRRRGGRIRAAWFMTMG